VAYVTGEIYHIYNRGVEKRNIFRNKADYIRFLNSLHEFNTWHTAENTHRDVRMRRVDGFDMGELVCIEEYVLMPNHFHLALRQLDDGGISKFMQKVASGYTHYFNLKYARSGVLFQGRTKRKHVSDFRYHQYLLEYILLNPIDLVEPGWKESGIRDVERVIQFLDEYPWTSGNNHIRFKKQLLAPK
jgi:REP element-mobilizing transposase RayT